jgi:hypothetical protein
MSKNTIKISLDRPFKWSKAALNFSLASVFQLFIFQHFSTILEPYFQHCPLFTAHCPL